MAVIRGYRAGDMDALYAVALATGEAGCDASSSYRDPRLIGHIYVGPYAALLPALVLVVEDGCGVAGYVLGAVDTREFEERQETLWWPALRAVYPDTHGIPPDRRTPDQQRCHRIHHPLRMPDGILRDYPSHLHINLLPRLQGRGLGRELIRRWLRLAAAGGSPGVHLGVNAVNLRALGFYRALGFRPLAATVPEAPRALWHGIALEPGGSA